MPADAHFTIPSSSSFSFEPKNIRGFVTSSTTGATKRAVKLKVSGTKKPEKSSRKAAINAAMIPHKNAPNTVLHFSFPYFSVFLSIVRYIIAGMSETRAMTTSMSTGDIKIARYKCAVGSIRYNK